MDLIEWLKDTKILMVKKSLKETDLIVGVREVCQKIPQAKSLGIVVTEEQMESILAAIEEIQTTKPTGPTFPSIYLPQGNLEIKVRLDAYPFICLSYGEYLQLKKREKELQLQNENVTSRPLKELDTALPSDTQ